MQQLGLLHKLLEKELPSIHKIRLKNLLDSVSALLKSNKLTLTSLGGHLPGRSTVRSNIRKQDRILGNHHLQTERKAFYETMTSFLLQHNTMPWIHIDWSCICSLTKCYLIRASLSMSGRSIVLYEECHSKSGENNHKVHKSFLNNLKSVLPETAKPVIVTDAGFRAPWFTYVREIGWDFVGRLRNKNLIFLKETSSWELSGSLYKLARHKPQYLGSALLTRAAKVSVELVRFKERAKNRHKLTKYNELSASGRSKRYAKAQNEPWILVTSLPQSKDLARQTVNIYKQRMRIEENFRDTKCTRYGFGLKDSRTKSTERMNILLLIAAIATFACWIAGIHAKNRGKDKDYQAHSAKFSSLSFVYLGREVLKKNMRIRKKQFYECIQEVAKVSTLTQMEGA